jgi:chromosome segregation ATPase
MTKQISAMLAALLITVCVGAAIFAVGGVALLNRNGAAPANSQVQASQISASSSSQDVQQLQQLVSQYQAREQQYQQREQQYKQQLDQANSQLQANQRQMQQVQLLLTALQQRGLITITSDGQVMINR